MKTLLLSTALFCVCLAGCDRVSDQKSAEAQQKLDRAGQEAKQATAEAGQKLGHAALLAKVKTALAMDAGLRSLGTVKVEVSEDTVRLTGTVRSEAEKQQVERAVSHVDGVAHVVDDLTVQ